DHSGVFSLGAFLFDHHFRPGCVPFRVSKTVFDAGVHGKAVAVAGDYAYFVTYDDPDFILRIIDVSISATPNQVGSCKIGWGFNVAVDGSYAYIAGSSIAGSGLQVIDISNPVTPTQVSAYHISNALGLAVTEGYAYVTDEGLGGLYVLDVSDPAAPSEVGSFTAPLAGTVSVAVAGGYVYIIDDDAGLLVLRFTGESETYTMSGYVRDGDGKPVSGVTVSAGAGGLAATDPSGAYTLTNVLSDTYTLVPSKAGWTFNPSALVVSVPPDATGQDFVGSTHRVFLPLVLRVTL
ncbi:MAG: carboxypeptidase regulatory-like domain-containing protein, partial [Anaerolineae bacterium]|nr:carboxypeptidase regulatory-like domain-containing protein [Anaerolineae bacterium]